MQLLFLDNQVGKNIVQAFCWMLVHSLWQGLIITLFCGLTIYLTRKRSAVLRYNALTLLFVIFLLGCLVTFINECGNIFQVAGPYNPVITSVSTSFYLINISALQRLAMSFSRCCSTHALAIVMIWFVFFLFKLTSMIRSLSHVRLIKNIKVNNPGSFWEDRIKLLGAKINISKQVSLLESAIVKIPVVVGYLRPIILIPIGLLNNLPAEQVEAVLLHELAHIRRNDYFINFIQNIAETVFFFNPALLWLSASMKIERENCCDDIALDLTKNKKQFLEALISFKEYASVTNSHALAFPGRKNQLLHRFTRIITNRNKSLVVSEKIFLLITLFCCLVVFIVLTGQANPSENSHQALIRQKPALNTPAKTVLPQAAPVNESNIALTVNKKRVESKMARRLIKERRLMNFKLEQADKSNKELALNSVLIRVTSEDYQYQSITTIKTAVENNYRSVLAQQHGEESKQQSDLERKRAEEDKIEAEKKMQQALIDKRNSARDQQRSFAGAQDALQLKIKAEKDMQAIKINHAISQYIE